jgi:AAA+ superfamily predicted ATPase
LTSNRVGTFDEAFKSRIQLALHYDNLDKGQRHQIWANFLNRLENLNVDMDFAEIRGKIGILAGRDMNGRQIRNVITTARQLAKHEKTQVKYDHLVHVMDVSRKFDDYLLEVNDHVTDAERQRDDGVR